MTSKSTQHPDAPPAAGHRRFSVVAAILFGLLFAYDLVEAVTNLVGVPAEIATANEFAVANDLALLPVPWGVLVANLLLPAASFALAWWLGRGRSILHQVMLFLTGLAVVAALSLTLASLV